MMKLRILPVVISVAVSSIVLFGGWFAYHSVAMENPLKEMIGNINGVESVQLVINSEIVHIRLELEHDASLREIYRHIVDEGSSIIGRREVKLDVTNPSSSTLDQWWSNILFEIAQAMESKRYADIPKVLADQTQTTSEVKSNAEMDDKYVYIRLSERDHSKFIMLPRTAVSLGVWSHE